MCLQINWVYCFQFTYHWSKAAMIVLLVRVRSKVTCIDMERTLPRTHRKSVHILVQVPSLSTLGILRKKVQFYEKIRISDKLKGCFLSRKCRKSLSRLLHDWNFSLANLADCALIIQKLQLSPEECAVQLNGPSTRIHLRPHAASRNLNAPPNPVSAKCTA